MKKKFNARVIGRTDIELAHDESPRQKICFNDIVNAPRLQPRESYVIWVAIEYCLYQFNRLFMRFIATGQSSLCMRRYPIVRLIVFLWMLSSYWKRPLAIGKTDVLNSIAGLIHASKYFSRIRTDTRWFSNTRVCLWNDAPQIAFNLRIQ